MKREYNRPTVEKLVFNYRDQVVAASGISGHGMDGSSDGKDCWEIIGDWLEDLWDIFC